MNGFWSTATLVALTAGLSAQTPGQAPAPPNAATQERPTFKVQVDLVTNDIIVRDEKGNFIPDLKKEDFEIFEDGVKQDISSMTVVTGGWRNRGAAAAGARVSCPPVNDLHTTLASVQNRRKALIYVSEGHDFNPFQDARLGLMDPNAPFAQNEFARNQNQANASSGDGSSPQTDP